MVRYTIELEAMHFHAFHGCFELERRVGNHFEVTLRIDATAEDLSSDEIGRVVNYLTVYLIVKEQMERTCHTIEAAAHNIIEAIKEHSTLIEGVECRLSKIAPPLGGKVERATVILKK